MTEQKTLNAKQMKFVAHLLDFGSSRAEIQDIGERASRHPVGRNPVLEPYKGRPDATSQIMSKEELLEALREAWKRAKY